MISEATLAVLIQLGVINPMDGGTPIQQSEALKQEIESGDLIFNEKSQQWELPQDYISILKAEGIIEESMLAERAEFRTGGR